MLLTDAIWVEVIANFNLNIYFINLGDKFFAPMNVWVISSQDLRLRNTSEHTQIQLIKRIKRYGEG